ncbi:hypothetical protein DB30_04433 [Enhygromyxa salina]|uniref:Lipoprotein n=1 Tax=Enhygromyxa salina TaxID=215803 RepID=A0A0C2D4A7_9BACT|nr:hypothetical protein [Enhygromyxa salina]KIG16520.1 hypothetical protein DB30_04433 [Enhygromyxa salina]
MSRIHLSLRIVLSASALTAFTACDLEERPDTELALDVEDSDLDIVELDGHTSTPSDPAVLLASPQGQQQQPVVQMWSWTSFGYLSALSDGDVVQLNNRQRGFIGCPDLATVSATPAPPNPTAGYAWLVHVVDVDNDGQDERQFEALDLNGNPTGRFLKMKNDDSVVCDSINGIGDAAAWIQTNGYGATTSGWTKLYGQMRSLKYDRCIQLTDPSAPIGDICPGDYRAFSFEVLN